MPVERKILFPGFSWVAVMTVENQPPEFLSVWVSVTSVTLISVPVAVLEMGKLVSVSVKVSESVTVSDWVPVSVSVLVDVDTDGFVDGFTDVVPVLVGVVVSVFVEVGVDVSDGVSVVEDVLDEVSVSVFDEGGGVTGV